METNASGNNKKKHRMKTIKKKLLIHFKILRKQSVERIKNSTELNLLGFLFQYDPDRIKL